MAITQYRECSVQKVLGILQYGFSPFLLDECSSVLKNDWSSAGKLKMYSDQFDHNYTHDQLRDIVTENVVDEDGEIVHVIGNGVV